MIRTILTAVILVSLTASAAAEVEPPAPEVIDVVQLQRQIAIQRLRDRARAQQVLRGLAVVRGQIDGCLAVSAEAGKVADTARQANPELVEFEKATDASMLKIQTTATGYADAERSTVGLVEDIVRVVTGANIGGGALGGSPPPSSTAASSPVTSSGSSGLPEKVVAVGGTLTTVAAFLAYLRQRGKPAVGKPAKGQTSTGEKSATSGSGTILKDFGDVFERVIATTRNGANGANGNT